VAFKSAAANADLIAIDTEGIWHLSAVATNQDGNSAVAVGNQLFINRTTGVISKDHTPSTHTFFGYALYPITAGETDVIPVKVHFDPNNEVQQEDLADEVTYSQYLMVSGVLDNQTVDMGEIESDCDIIHVSYFTSQAAGTGLGIDLVDGGADGSGSAVIDSSEDNLDGIDDNELTTPYAMLAGEHIKIAVDDVTASTFILVKVTLKVVLNEET
jgi:hypothetical protein